MARVETFEGGSVAPAQATTARVQAQDFGPGIGPGLQRLGEGLGKASEVADQIGQLHDEAVVKEAVNRRTQWFAQAGYTGQDAYFAKKGRDALDARPMIDKGLMEGVKQDRATLQNERQRRLFDNAMTPQVTEWQTQIGRYASGETLTYAANESEARAGLSAEMAGHTWMDNPVEGEQHIATMKAEIEKTGRIQGLPAEQIVLKQLKATSGVYHDIGLQIASAGPQGWGLAREFVNQHGGDMTDDDRRAVLDRADVEQRSFEAEQRRQEAELRRQQTEAKRDARDRATSAASNIDLGIPMKPGDYATALSDAQASGDEALVKRIQVGQFKNNLSLQHQDDTPYQLQARINDLNTKIAKAGTDAQPNDVIERDHLTQMLGRSREQLKTNPLAWGAQHLGMDVKPLVLSDPNSVTNRINAVTALRKQTGVDVGPLQPDEIAVAQHTLTNGNVQQKVDMVLKLSKLGPYAMDAAEQVTNNPNVLNVVGLATLSNRGVAASRVNQVYTGVEALKTRPKLIDKDQASQQFNEYVGGALQFLPQTRAGVMANAQALLGAEANDHGWNEWGQIDSRAWFRAVNSALGAYTRNGEQVGGLAKFNGGITVLPENMSQSEFETAISRAHGPEFRRAQNGEPVFADGRSPSATDIKKMQWVPSGDGIYRLTDGNGFLKTKQGGFYEIDMSKLNSFDAVLAAHGYSRH